ncbi:response regulator transcription factor [Noviherbaspirillum denitrificans]|uniref:Two-component system response regulator n=1 Tax=Noviherbaspirillum denitrificans TaxID=1968433 RepID=A0A254T7T4_9BURK|nr:response regulator transcription factor [Noviherbaspirillum denitrificans]OWW18635.1 two-component system response regulator [Noviherbaspirillum denitrificans]
MTDDSRLIVVVEDDHLVARTLQTTLRDFGFTAEWCRTGAELLRLMRERAPALCIIDLGLPDGDGLDLVRRLQSEQRCGILIVTGRGFLTDRVIGLELGADDYMTKPFEPRELVARVRSILRRTGRGAPDLPAAKASVRRARFAEWLFEPANLTLTDDAGRSEELSAAEARLLTLFLENPNRILDRERLAGSRDLSPYDRSIDVRVSRLRKRLRDSPSHPVLIKTVYGAGYLFAGRVEWEDS